METNISAQRAVESLSELGPVRNHIQYLRRTYGGTKGAPDFTNLETQLAYAIAYHPAHAFVYLHLLLRRNLGSTIFSHINPQPKILVLGAGLLAETIALTQWMSHALPEVLKQSSFTLVDRADWSKARPLVSMPTIHAGSWNGSENHLVSLTIDLASDEGRKFLAQELASFDLIICPSILTEMHAEKSSAAFIDLLCRSMSPRSILVVFDHHLRGTWDSIHHECANRFELVTESYKPAEVALPSPPAWTCHNLLTGGDGLIPTRSVTTSWLVLRN